MTDNQPLHIDVYSDTICPWCFIGKRRFERALAERPDVRVQVTWLPFQLNPDMPSEGMDRRVYLERKFGGSTGARQAYQPVIAAGSEEGIEFDFEALTTTPNTLQSHRLIHFAAGQPPGQDSVVEALFERYFERGENIGDVDVLEASAVEAGLDPARTRAYLDSDDDQRTIEAQDVMARQMGIQGVPYFVFERKYAVSGAQSPAVMIQVFDELVKSRDKVASSQ